MSGINPKATDRMSAHTRWLRKDLWALDDAIFLLHNVDPDNSDKLIRNSKQFEKMYLDALDTAVKAEGITLPIFDTSTYMGTEGKVYAEVEPKNFIQWADSKEYAIPEPFQQLLGNQDVKVERQEESLDIRERKTLLRVIYALAIDCGYKINEPHKDAKEVVANAELKGLSVPAAKTIAEKLREAKELVEEE
jgi:hypothetical protein